MGVGIDAFLEWDESNDEAPFMNPNGQVFSLTEYGDLRGGKDYAFIGSLCGVRAPRDSLFPSRGLPPNVSPELSRGMEDLYDIATQKVSWLTLDEIRQSMAHQDVAEADLSLPSRLVLHLMHTLERRLGKGRVRLVFGVE